MIGLLTRRLILFRPDDIFIVPSNYNSNFSEHYRDFICMSNGIEFYIRIFIPFYIIIFDRVLARRVNQKLNIPEDNFRPDIVPTSSTDENVLDRFVKRFRRY